MTVDPILTYAAPDVEALVWSVVKKLPGTHNSWAYASNDGGEFRGAPREWLRVVSMQVDTRGSRKELTFAWADAVRRAVLALPYQPWDGGVVARVIRTEGPIWLPDEDGRPRYLSRFDVFVHPRPDKKASPA